MTAVFDARLQADGLAGVARLQLYGQTCQVGDDVLRRSKRKNKHGGLLFFREDNGHAVDEAEEGSSTRTTKS